jgi:hypothetical protein
LAYQRQQGRLTSERIRATVRQVTLQIHHSSEYPSYNQLMVHLSSPWLMEKTVAKEAWREILNELDWQQTSGY